MTDHGAVCTGLLEDAARRELLLRHERDLAAKELADVRQQLAEAFRQVGELRVRLARPLIPEERA